MNKSSKMDEIVSPPTIFPIQWQTYREKSTQKKKSWENDERSIWVKCNELKRHWRNWWTAAVSASTRAHSKSKRRSIKKHVNYKETLKCRTIEAATFGLNFFITSPCLYAKSIKKFSSSFQRRHNYNCLH